MDNNTLLVTILDKQKTYMNKENRYSSNMGIKVVLYVRVKNNIQTFAI